MQQVGVKFYIYIMVVRIMYNIKFEKKIVTINPLNTGE
jgi:hypothetical protein